MDYKKSVYILFIVFSLFAKVVFFPGEGKTHENNIIIPNYPLEVVRYIYGKHPIRFSGREKRGDLKEDQLAYDTDKEGGTPVSCIQNSKGLVYVVYSGKRSEIQVFDQKGNHKFIFGKSENGRSFFSSYICGISINSKDEVFVADVKKKEILVFSEQGKYLRSFSSIQGLSPNDPKQNIYPAHIAIDKMDRLFISDGLNGRVYIYNTRGEFQSFLGAQTPGLFPSAAHIHFDNYGNIFILEGLGKCCIQVCTPNGDPLRCIGTAGGHVGEFQRISGLAIDNTDRIYATDIVQCVIQIFDPNGTLIGVVKEVTNKGKKQKLNSPTGIFIDRDNNIYVIEQSLHRIIVLRHPEIVLEHKKGQTVSD